MTYIWMPSALAQDHVPLEKQFADFFSERCVQSMSSQLKQDGKDPETEPYKGGVGSYCGCTSQAIVSLLNAEEILQFASNPEQEPGASKVRASFLACRDKVRQSTQ